MSEVKGKPGGNPEPGDRLRFVFVFVSCVACVRAGEAKLQVRARCRVFLLGRPRLWEVLLLLAASLRSSGRGVRWGFKAKWVQICIPGRSLRVFGGGFMRVLHKTYLLKPMCGAYHTGRISLKPVCSTASEGKSSAKPWLILCVGPL